MNRSTKILGSAVAISCLCWAMPAAAAPTATFAAETPAADSAVMESVRVEVTISSAAVLTSVTATVGTATTTLTNLGGDRFGATLDLSALPFGPTLVTVNATDGLGDTSTITRTFKHDTAPTLSITGSRYAVVARPKLRVTATCNDGDLYACTSISVLVENTVLETITGNGATLTFDKELSLAAYDERFLLLRVIAEDAAGAKTESARHVYVDSNHHLVEVTTVPGKVEDFDGTRILYRDHQTETTTWTIRNRTSGADTPTPVLSDHGTRGYLTPAGAILETGDFRNGILTALPGGPPKSLQRAGTWAVWRGFSDGSIYRRNLTTGVDDAIPPGGALPACATSSDAIMDGTLAVNVAGEVAWTTVPSGLPAYAFKTKRYTNGVISDLGDQLHVRLGGQLAILSGTPTLRDWCGEVGLPRDRTIQAVGTSGGILDASRGTDFAYADTDYRVSEGNYTAFTKPVNGMLTAYTRTPAGAIELLHPLPNVTRIAGVNDVGEAMVDIGRSRWLSQSNGATPKKPIHVSAENGRAVYRDGAWHLMLANTLFRIDPNAEPSDGGVAGDGGPQGSQDAAPSDSLPDAGGGGGAGDGGSTLSSSGSAPTSDESDDGGCSAAGTSVTSSWLLAFIGAIVGMASTRKRRRSKSS